MSYSEKFNESDIVEDHTKVLSKIWDNLMPRTYPHVLEFTTNKAVEVLKIKKLGPYHMEGRFIHYDCHVLIDKEPLVNIGWNINDDISDEMVDKAYGKNYFYNMKIKLIELSKYAALKIHSSFDFGGELDATIKY